MSTKAYAGAKRRKLDVVDEDEPAEFPAGRARSWSHEDYTVGWICALPVEFSAAEAMLDYIHPSLRNPPKDDNTYTLGQIGAHNVVITCLPAGIYGTTSAAIVANKMQSTFRSIGIGLMVGIGGGAPSKLADIRLGDVVVSKPTENFGGVIPYDCGKTVEEGVLRRTGTLNKPPQVLLKAVSKLQADKLQSVKFQGYLTDASKGRSTCADEFANPGPQEDRLFEAQYEHVGFEGACDTCDLNRVMPRPIRSTNIPLIHYGLIASGNQLIKHGSTRDKLAREYGILCFEMEAAGLMDHFPSLVVRGISDYSDSHKNKKWQAYAAVAAAAYAKAVVSVLPEAQVAKPVTVVSAISMIEPPYFVKDEAAKKMRTEILDWISTFKYRQRYLDMAKPDRRMKGTGQWLLDSSILQHWLYGDPSQHRLVWCCGDPGTGKTILSTFLIDHIVESCSARNTATVYHFISHLDPASRTCLAVLRSILRQLGERLVPLPLALMALYNELDTKGKEIDIEETKLALQACIGMFDRVFIVIDALDEVSPQERRGLLIALKTLALRCKIIVTSRPHLEDVSLAFHDDYRIDVSAQEGDLQLYIRARIYSTTHLFREHETFVDEIVRKIIHQARGLFLLAVLHTDNVLREPTIGDALKALSSIPDNVQPVFRSMLDRVATQQGQTRAELARRALAALAYVKRPLHCDELCDLLSVRPSQKRLDMLFQPSVATILDCCGGLVVMDENTSTIHLVHFSLQEYIQSNPSGQEIAPPITLGQLCLEYLKMDNFATGPCDYEVNIIGRVESFPFYSYAARWLGHHVNGYDSLIKPTLELLRSRPLRGSLAQIVKYDAGLRREYWCAEETASNNPLTVAAWYSMHEITRMLLDEDHIPVDSATSMGTTALIRSASENDTVMVKMLIQRGADPYRSNWYGSTLHCVAHAGHCEMMEYLLGLGLDIDFRDDKGRTPLHCAITEGHADMVKLLLRWGAAMDAVTDAGDTHLSLALYCKESEICFILMEHLALTGQYVHYLTALPGNNDA